MSKETYITILRGINVSGSNVIKMQVLKEMFEEIGYENVKTYIQSGNVLFNFKASNTDTLAKQIEEAFLEKFKMTVPTLVFKLEEMEDILTSNPLLKSRQDELAMLHVTLLSEIPAEERLEKIENEKYLPDEFTFVKKAIYLFCPNGYGKTKLVNNFFENKLKLKATTRNWKTMNELLRLAEEVSKSA